MAKPTNNSNRNFELNFGRKSRTACIILQYYFVCLLYIIHSVHGFCFFIYAFQFLSTFLKLVLLCVLVSWTFYTLLNIVPGGEIIPTAVLNSYQLLSKVMKNYTVTFLIFQKIRLDWYCTKEAVSLKTNVIKKI